MKVDILKLRKLLAYYFKTDIEHFVEFSNFSVYSYSRKLHMLFSKCKIMVWIKFYKESEADRLFSPLFEFKNISWSCEWCDKQR